MADCIAALHRSQLSIVTQLKVTHLQQFPELGKMKRLTTIPALQAFCIAKSIVKQSLRYSDRSYCETSFFGFRCAQEEFVRENRSSILFKCFFFKQVRRKSVSVFPQFCSSFFSNKCVENPSYLPEDILTHLTYVWPFVFLWKINNLRGYHCNASMRWHRMISLKLRKLQNPAVHISDLLYCISIMCTPPTALA